MEIPKTKSGMAGINGARIYYETAGEGMPLVIIRAWVADNRQWNNEFAYFARWFRLLRYDMRGYGKSEPVHGVTMIKMRDGLIGNWREYWYASPPSWEEFTEMNGF